MQRAQASVRLCVQLPLGAEHGETRRAALAVLAAMLGELELALRADGSPAVTAEYVSTALGRLTAHELVQLLDWPQVAGAGTPPPWCAPAGPPTLVEP